MTVAELISALSAFPPEMRVHVLLDGGDHDYAAEPNTVEITDGYGLRPMQGVLIHNTYVPRMPEAQTTECRLRSRGRRAKFD